ncbi:hypothetical protein BLNAU_14139 [Blattamonas nauphoetae]|uniref:Cyclin N-terminal domain-containing protein n=1 Tax=Blattamonas nauphoetae TaxID=2049346 RepID=A0ABQ9XJF4_9EUKA|nr:hypothetical protein BLNAU_14139 [Blattamonas nauphoetae]
MSYGSPVLLNHVESESHIKCNKASPADSVQSGANCQSETDYPVFFNQCPTEILFDTSSSIEIGHHFALFYSLSASYCCVWHQKWASSCVFGTPPVNPSPPIPHIQKNLPIQREKSQSLDSSFWLGTNPLEILSHNILSSPSPLDRPPLDSSRVQSLVRSTRLILRVFTQKMKLCHSELALALVLLCRAIYPLSSSPTTASRTVGHLTTKNAGMLLLIALISACKHLRDGKVPLKQIATYFSIDSHSLLKSETSFYSALGWHISSVRLDLQIASSYLFSIVDFLTANTASLRDMLNGC